jgi:hypothetical protein
MGAYFKSVRFIWDFERGKLRDEWGFSFIIVELDEEEKIIIIKWKGWRKLDIKIVGWIIGKE